MTGADNMFKKISIIATIIITFSILISCSKESGEKKSDTKGQTVTWQNFNKGIELAAKEKKPIVIDFYADWCKWCKVMEKETFSDPEVSEKLNKSYIAIRINTDKAGSEPIKYKNHEFTIQHFSMMMGVQGLPTVVFMDKDGKPITKIPGFVKKDVFLPLLNYITDGCHLQNVPFESYVKGENPCKNNKI